MLGKRVAIGNALAGVPRAGELLRDAGIGDITRRPYPASWRMEMDRMQLEVREYFSSLPNGDSGDGLTRRGCVTLSRYNEETSP
jgi:hypothetical protein